MCNLVKNCFDIGIKDISDNEPPKRSWIKPVVVGMVALGVASLAFFNYSAEKTEQIIEQNPLFSEPCGTAQNPCWLSTNLTSLQERVSQLNWSEALSAIPPLPLFNPINMTLAQQWIGSHCSEGAKRVAKWMIDHVNHISHKTFEEGLAETVDDFNQQLAASADQNYAAIVTENGKSNRWVTSLALKYLNRLPTEVLSGNHFLEQIKRLKIRKLAFFDDAIYSGQQMSYWLHKVLTEMKNLYKDNDFEAYVVVPFIGSKHRFEFLKTMNDPFKVVKHRELPLVKTVLGQNKTFHDEVAEFCDISMYEHKIHTTLTYFDHKIPDFMSFLCDHRFRRGTIGGESEGCNPDRIPSVPFVKDNIPVYKFL